MAIEVADDNEAISFQTGRIYSRDGQRMAATKLRSGDIAFYDMDRMISGVLDAKLLEAMERAFNKEDIMWCYDRGEYFRYWEHVARADDSVWSALRAIASTVPSLNL